ncbi:MAG: hypothetical protein JRH11_08400, partial [Deltaproteobacteria bacterium]|nr:hypothetical protein [Deltaproteobacteria bacterium]
MHAPTRASLLLLLLLPLFLALALVACGDDGPPPGDSGMDTGGDGDMPDTSPPVDGGDLCMGVDCSAMDDMCNDGVCDPATGGCLQEPLVDGTACDDADLCTGTSVCAAGTCEGSDPPDCTAMDDQCNVGMCDTMSGDCMAAPVMDGTMCDDADSCTNMDACGGGACAGVDACGGALYAENFEASDGGWTTGGTNSSWEYGTPDGSIIDAAANGTGAWVTNLDGDYNNSEDSYIESPVLDFSTATADPLLRFSHIFVTEGCCDEGWVEVSTDGGSTFNKVGTAATGISWYNDATNDWWDGTSSGWRNAQHTLAGTAGEADVRIRFVFSSDSSATREGFGVDDILVIPDADGDLAVDALTVPAPACSTTTGTLTVGILNLGTTDVTGFDVTHTVGSMAPVTETSTATITAGGTFDFSFTADISVTADAPLTVRVTATGDPILLNDARSTAIAVIPEVAGAAYAEDFEADDGGFRVGGNGASWAHGIPSGSYIRAAGQGTSAWVTNLAGGYNDSEDSYAQSICLDFTSTTADPILQFRHTYQTELNFDEGWVEISTDSGATWTKLTGGASAINWYDDTTNEWWEGDSAAGSGTWQWAQGVLTGAAGNSAILRFHMSSDSSNTGDGFGFDDLSLVTDVDGDLAVEVQRLEASCGTSGGDVVVTVRNLGSTDVTGFDIEYAEGTAAAVMETSTDTVTAGGTLAFTFATPVSVSAASTLTVTVAAAGDPNAGNNATTVTVPAPLPVMAIGTGYAEDFEADDGGWVVSGTSASWAWGAPSGTFIPAAAAGTNAWVTNLSGDYNSDELSYLAT